MCSRSKLYVPRLLRSWALDLSSPGTVPALPTKAGNAVQAQLRDVQLVQTSGGSFAASLGTEGCSAEPIFMWRTDCNPGLWTCPRLGPCQLWW